MNERQSKYLEVLRTTGNPSRARQAAGVVRKTVSLWERDEEFSEAAAEAQAAAMDEIVEASRNAALSGDSAQMTNWLKIARPELRPAGAQVAVGVRVDGRGSLEDARHRRLQAMSDEELLAELDAFHRDLQTRVEYQRDRHAHMAVAAPAGEVIDVVATPVAQPEPERVSGPISPP